MKRFLGLALLFSFASADAALIGGEPVTPGGSDFQVYYDTTMDMTWLANANLAATQTFGVAGIEANGSMDWNEANSWIAGMNAAQWLDYSAWRMPTMVDIDGDGCVFRNAYNGADCGYNTVRTGPNASEMSSMYYDTLQNTPFIDDQGNNTGVIGIQNTAPFSNLVSELYWTGLNYEPNGSPTGEAWYFGMPSGGQGKRAHSWDHWVWAVADGNAFNISTVPVPAAAWLFGSAIALLGWTRRRNS